jgi:hypothetical protein
MELPPNPHCGAKLKSRDGLCGKQAGWGTDHLGFGNCKLHGGATTNGKKHGETLRQEYWARLVEMGDPALTGLLELVTSAETEAVRLGAIRDVLDRIGFGAKHVHEHTGPGGGPIPVEVRAAELLERARALRPATNKRGVKGSSSKRKGRSVESSQPTESP